TDGDRHADHAEGVALPARLGARQPAQRQNEQDARHEISDRSSIRIHQPCPNAGSFANATSLITLSPPERRRKRWPQDAAPNRIWLRPRTPTHCQRWVRTRGKSRGKRRSPALRSAIAIAVRQ